ncbi:MAG: D-alanine--D-alanine ligase, partial [Myxococcota bacterium]|nr:D-alanine--D-alanine ligase [Myxococcota bacterium]
MKVAVLRGGRSHEHDVSLVTAGAVSDALVLRGHEVLEVTLGRDGGASWGDSDDRHTGRVGQALDALQSWGAQAVFIAMHGAYGEDGRVQGALELLGVPYQGTDTTGSAIAMDKGRAKAVYRAAGLPVADDVMLTRDQLETADWGATGDRIGFPCVLKTAESGSSVGIEVIGSREELAAAGHRLLATSTSLVVEAWLPGREFTVAVLEDSEGVPTALPVVEIRPHGERWFDYETKYDPELVDELCPAPIDEALAAELMDLGLRAHTALRCRDYSRTDIKLDSTGRPRLMETNTLPGLTSASLMPKAAA